jgi:hypothetical protein
MTAAFQHLCGPALRARGARLFGALALLVPIPTMAALGLSLPLPASVERLAAKLVPFGDGDSLDPSAAQPIARGSIVLAPGERAAETPTAARGSELALRRSHAGAQKRVGGRAHPMPIASDLGDQTDSMSGTADAARTSTRKPGADVSSPASSGGNGTTTTTPPPTTGGTPPAPNPSAVDTATNTANGAVETATNTATTATDTAAKAADSAATTVSNTVGGLKPP